MKKYIGITIGPIFKTINLTSSPVSLWASSYIFSLLSKTICEKLVDNGVDEKNIVTPYYENGNLLIDINNGVGLFPDHIIFDAEGYDITNINNVKNDAISVIAEQFSVSEEYLKKYIMISAVEFEAENPIAESSKIFDSLELATPFVAEEESNPILSLFTGDEMSKNSSLKGIPAITNLTEFQLKKTNKTFKSIEDIVGTGKEYKKYKYYAIVRSDGDNMGKIISGLTDTREFSKTCLQYCLDIAKLVSEFDGVTIYSGGDDLLAILPCESRSGESVFSFVKKANNVFAKHFEKYNQPTSLSFGITIAYYKFPLYEVLEDSANLLFDVAKKDEKNRLAIRLQKHAGQSEGLVVPNSRLQDIIELMDTVKSGKQKASDDNDKVFLSAIHKIAMFEKAFNGAENQAEIENLFKNTFDGSEHTNNTFLHEKLPKFLVKLKEENSVKAISDNGIIENNPALTICYVLRILKFFFEKGGEEQ